MENLEKLSQPEWPVTDDMYRATCDLMDHWTRTGALDRAHIARIAKLGYHAMVDAKSDFDQVVWPGLEGEGLMRAAKAFRTAHEAADARGFSHDDSSRAGYTAAIAYLWRATEEG